MTESTDIQDAPFAELCPEFSRVASEEDRDLAELEPAWGKAALCFRTGLRLGHGRASVRCMPLMEVHRILGVYRARFEAGDTLSLLQAVNSCAEENLPLPEWLAVAFRAQMALFSKPGPVHSLDEVFSSPAMPTASPKKAATAKLDWQLGGRLWSDVWSLVNKDETIASFEAAVSRVLAAGNYGVAKTKAKALIVMVENSQSQFLAKDLSLSRFLEKRRKLMT
jgi:hypothetical protein